MLSLIFIFIVMSPKRYFRRHCGFAPFYNKAESVLVKSLSLLRNMLLGACLYLKWATYLPFPHRDLDFQGLCGEAIPGAGWIWTAARTRSTPHRSRWWTALLVPQPPAQPAFPSVPTCPCVQVTIFSPHSDFSTLATAGRRGQGARSGILGTSQIPLSREGSWLSQQHLWGCPVDHAALDTSRLSVKSDWVILGLQSQGMPWEGVQLAASIRHGCLYGTLVVEVTFGDRRSPPLAGCEYRTFCPSAFTRCEWTGSMWKQFCALYGK